MLPSPGSQALWGQSIFLYTWGSSGSLSCHRRAHAHPGHPLYTVDFSSATTFPGWRWHHRPVGCSIPVDSLWPPFRWVVCEAGLAPGGFRLSYARLSSQQLDGALQTAWQLSAGQAVGILVQHLRALLLCQ